MCHDKVPLPVLVRLVLVGVLDVGGGGEQATVLAPVPHAPAHRPASGGVLVEGIVGDGEHAAVQAVLVDHALKVVGDAGLGAPAHGQDRVGQHQPGAAVAPLLAELQVHLALAGNQQEHRRVGDPDVLVGDDDQPLPQVDLVQIEVFQAQFLDLAGRGKGFDNLPDLYHNGFKVKS